MTDEPWKRLATAVRARREDLGLSQVQLALEAGISEPTVRVIEGARRQSYQRATLRALALALGWTPDSIQRILDGDAPIERQAMSDDEVERRLADLEARIANLEAEAAAKKARNRDAS